jgi:uncharacterized membrane protein YhaH (DUF805 family)
MDLIAVLFSRHGRIGRANYWLGVGVTVPLALLQIYLDRSVADMGDLAPAAAIFAIGILNLWISLCVAIKRYHDRGKSGWWVLICLIPLVGAIWQLVELGTMRGDEGPNEYGPDPLQSSGASGGMTVRPQDGHKSAASVSAATGPAATATMSRARSPYTDGRPVFGKRI